MKNLLAKHFNPLGKLLAMILFIGFAASCEKTDIVPGDNSGDNFRNPPKTDLSIADIAINNGFNELVGALTYVDTALDAGLVNLFATGTDQYTVFAPTDSAFTALYSTLQINTITDLPAELVLDVLFYHVTDGRRAANSVVPPRGERNIETLLGESFSVDTEGGITAIGSSANITAADFSAFNGIVHVIDGVLLPI